MSPTAETTDWTPFDLPKLQQSMLKSATGALYRIVVATPTGPAPTKGYPVIYVVDGNAWTSLISEIIRTNVGHGIQSCVEPAVVVGIGYSIDSAFDLTTRTLDLTSPVPSDYPDIGDNSTGGDIALMDFIDTRVKAVIGERFNIDKTRQTLLGHSLGGLFTLSTMFNRPRSFQTYVALSPSVHWNNRALLHEAQLFNERADLPHNLRVFLSVGAFEQFMPPPYIAHARNVLARSKTDAEANKELREMVEFYDRVEMVENTRQIAKVLITAHLHVKVVEFPGEDHFSVVPAALGRAIPFALGEHLPVR